MAAVPIHHSRDSSAPVRASAAEVLGVVVWGGVVVAAGVAGGGVRVTNASAVTGVLVVLVGHVVVVALGVFAAPTTAGVPQLGSLLEAVLVMVPVVSDALAVTENVACRTHRSHTGPDRPADVDPLTATVQVGGPPVAQAGQPATSVVVAAGVAGGGVRVNASAVRVVGSVVVAVPVFFTVIV
jgi:hypothetical protein